MMKIREPEALFRAIVRHELTPKVPQQAWALSSWGLEPITQILVVAHFGEGR